MRAQMSWISAISGRLTTAVHSIPVPKAAPATAYVVTPLGSSSDAPVTRPGPSVRKYRTSGLWLCLASVSLIEDEGGGAADGEPLVARHDRDPRRRQRARERVLGRRRRARGGPGGSRGRRGPCPPPARRASARRGRRRSATRPGPAR